MPLSKEEQLALWEAAKAEVEQEDKARLARAGWGEKAYVGRNGTSVFVEPPQKTAGWPAPSVGATKELARSDRVQGWGELGQSSAAAPSTARAPSPVQPKWGEPSPPSAGHKSTLSVSDPLKDWAKSQPKPQSMYKEPAAAASAEPAARRSSPVQQSTPGRGKPASPPTSAQPSWAAKAPATMSSWSAASTAAPLPAAATAPAPSKPAFNFWDSKTHTEPKFSEPRLSGTGGWGEPRKTAAATKPVPGPSTAAAPSAPTTSTFSWGGPAPARPAATPSPPKPQASTSSQPTANSSWPTLMPAKPTTTSAVWGDSKPAQAPSSFSWGSEKPKVTATAPAPIRSTSASQWGVPKDQASLSNLRPLPSRPAASPPQWQNQRVDQRTPSPPVPNSRAAPKKETLWELGSKPTPPANAAKSPTPTRPQLRTIPSGVTTERKQALSGLKIKIYSRTRIEPKYEWEPLLREIEVVVKAGVPLPYELPADAEIMKLLELEPSRSRLPDLKALAEKYSAAELGAVRVDQHLEHAIQYVWNDKRYSAREAAALSLDKDHALLFELVSNFAQVPRTRDAIDKAMPLLREKIKQQAPTIARLSTWHEDYIDHEKAVALAERYASDDKVPVRRKLPETLCGDRSLGIEAFPMLSMS